VLGELSRSVLVWGAIVLAALVAVVILVSLLSSDEEEAEEMSGVNVIDDEVPVEVRQLAVLYRIDRKLRVVHLVAILALVGWLLTCLAMAIGLALGPTVLLSELLRRLLPWG
jgi:hypothetical protein